MDCSTIFKWLRFGIIDRKIKTCINVFFNYYKHSGTLISDNFFNTKKSKHNNNLTLKKLKELINKSARKGSKKLTNQPEARSLSKSQPISFTNKRKPPGVISIKIIPIR